jgi:hypothetical protein
MIRIGEQVGHNWRMAKAPDFKPPLMQVIELKSPLWLPGIGLPPHSQSSGSRAQRSQRGCLALVRELWCNDVTLGQPWTSCVHFIADALQIRERREIRVLKPQAFSSVATSRRLRRLWPGDFGSSYLPFRAALLSRARFSLATRLTFSNCATAPRTCLINRAVGQKSDQVRLRPLA